MSRKIAVIGADGRMGREVLRELSLCASWSLHTAVVSPASARAGSPVNTGVSYTADFESIAGAEVAIDFSTPESSAKAVEAAARHGVPILVATTGHSSEVRERIAAHSGSVPVLLAPNTSMGVFALHRAAAAAQRILGRSADIEISETHHRAKKDAPSGTALSLAETLRAEGDLSVVTEREVARRTGEIGISSVRGGSVAGDHTIFFLMDGERIEITHRAENRSIFARGALEFAERLIGRKCGLYRVDDLV